MGTDPLEPRGGALMDLPDVATVISAVIATATVLVAVTSAINKFRENAGWRKVTALRAAAKDATADLASDDLVVVAAAQTERRMILEKLTNKQYGTGPWWFVFSMGGVILIVQSAAATSTADINVPFLVLGLFAFTSGMIGALVMTFLRTTLLDLHSPPSVLLPKAQQEDIVRRQVLNAARAERRAARRARQGTSLRRLFHRLHLVGPFSEAPALAPVPEAGAQGAAGQEVSASQEPEAGKRDQQ